MKYDTRKHTYGTPFNNIDRIGCRGQFLNHSSIHLQRSNNNFLFSDYLAIREKKLFVVDFAV